MEKYFQICIILMTIISIHSSNKDFEKKYCDSLQSDAKIAELEKCDSSVPNEVRIVFLIILKMNDTIIEPKN